VGPICKKVNSLEIQFKGIDARRGNKTVDKYMKKAESNNRYQLKCKIYLLKKVIHPIYEYYYGEYYHVCIF
jgi:hypothetical protein